MKQGWGNNFSSSFCDFLPFNADLSLLGKIDFKFAQKIYTKTIPASSTNNIIIKYIGLKIQMPTKTVLKRLNKKLSQSRYLSFVRNKCTFYQQIVLVWISISKETFPDFVAENRNSRQNFLTDRKLTHHSIHAKQWAHNLAVMIVTDF